MDLQFNLPRPTNSLRQGPPSAGFVASGVRLCVALRSPLAQTAAPVHIRRGTNRTLRVTAQLRLLLIFHEINLAVRRMRLKDSQAATIPLPFRGWLDASQRNPVRTRKYSTCTRKAINHELHRNDPIQGSRYLHIGVLHHPRPDSGSHSGSGTERRFSTIRQSAGPFGKPDLQHGGQSTAGRERRQPTVKW